MKKKQEDNTISVVQKAMRHYGIKVTDNSVKVAMKSNSYYPTLRSICDALSEWKIEHYPLRYELDEIKNIRGPFIVHFNIRGGQVAFVSKIFNNRVTYYDSIHTHKEEGIADFIEKCSGAVILLNPNERSGEKDYRKKFQNELLGNSILPLISLALLLYIIRKLFPTLSHGIVSVEKLYCFLFLTKISGIALSSLLILHDFEIHSPIVKKLCHLNKATNCNTVLNDKASKVFGWFGWADAGFVYFFGGLFILLQGFDSHNFSILTMLSVLSLPYPIFSIYYQGFVLKKWCPLCIIVQLVLIIEFILLLPQLGILNFSFSEITGFILTFLIAGIIYLVLNMYIRERMLNEIHYYKYLRFKKNKNVLNALLLNQECSNIPISDTSLVFGSKDPQLKITAFLSLNCSHCARAFEKIKEVLKSDEKISINVVLITSEINIINTLYYYNLNGNEEAALNLLDRWYGMDPYSRERFHDSFCIPDIDDISKKVSNDIYLRFKESKVFVTPTFFINGYRLPMEYDLDDIKYFYSLIEKPERVTTENSISK